MRIRPRFQIFRGLILSSLAALLFMLLSGCRTTLFNVINATSEDRRLDVHSDVAKVDAASHHL